MLRFNSHRLNIDAVLKIVILWGFALFFLIITSDGKVLLYVNPRIVPYVKFGIAAMFGISLFYIRDIFRPGKNVNTAAYLFFLIPLFLAFALPAKPLTSSSIDFNGIKLSQQKNSQTAVNSAADTSVNTAVAGDPSSKKYAGQQSELGLFRIRRITIRANRYRIENAG